MEQPTPNSKIIYVPSSVTSVTLSDPRMSRPWVAVYNNSATATLFISLSSTAATNSFTCKVAPQGYYEVPARYTGPVSGVWSAADGAALVTELSY
jgi:hypothetical protein